MPSIPADVLREILEHLGKNDLATLCRVNKICCSCLQNVLYREIYNGDGDKRVIQTLAKSTDLARRVRSFDTFRNYPELGTALQNMSSLRSLYLGDIDESILDGCTFKLDLLDITLRNPESLQKFLNSQPSLTNLTIWGVREPLTPFDERCLPNLTGVHAHRSWLGVLIPGRPVREVGVFSPSNINSTDLNFFTLATAPIHSLIIPYISIYPTPGSRLVSIFPSIENLVLETYELNWSVRRQLTVIGVLMKKSTIIDLVIGLRGICWKPARRLGFTPSL
jgi:F-box domain